MSVPRRVVVICASLCLALLVHGPAGAQEEAVAEVPGLLVTQLANPGSGVRVPEHRLSLASGEVERLADIDVAGAVASPDGTTIAWVEEVRTDQLQPDAFGAVMVWDRASGVVRRIPVPAMTAAVRPLSYADDGALLGATTPEGVVGITVADGTFSLLRGTRAGDVLLDLGGGAALITRVVDNESPPDLVLLGPGGSASVVPHDGFGTIRHGEIAPDGQGIAVSVLVSSTGFSQDDVWVGDVGGLQQVTGLNLDIFNRVMDLRWSPDSEAVAVGVRGSGFTGVVSEALTRIGTDGSAERLGHAASRVAGWLPDGTGLVVASEVGDPDTGLTSAAAQPVALLDVATGETEVLGVVANLAALSLVPGAALDPAALEPLASDTIAEALFATGVLPDDGVDTVLLARADDFPDSLASAVLQGALDAPLLLTPSDHLDQVVREEVLRLGAEHAVLLGGTTALGPEVEATLVERGLTVERVAGATRIDTAIAIAERTGGPSPTTLLVRAGAGAADPTQGWADSLAAGPVAATHGMSLLLTDTDALSTATRDALVAAEVATVWIVGGEAAISRSVAEEVEGLGITVIRIAGTGRAETAAALAMAARELPRPSDASVGPSTVIDGTTSTAWASGFAAARSTSAVGGHGLVLLSGQEIPQATRDALAATDDPPQDQPPIICGLGVSSATCGELHRAREQPE